MNVEFIREKFLAWLKDDLSEKDFKEALKEYSDWLRQKKLQENKINDLSR